MKCLGCYREKIVGYCNSCRKKLFDGSRVSHVLNFDAPREANFFEYQEKSKSLSLSGVQLKYSLRLEKNELKLTEKGGQYILKPIPPGLIVHQDQVPENEHLTMQIAQKIFNIPVAENALIYFKDGSPAYITRRFDVNSDGSKLLQEDFAQISEKTRKANGEHYKYEGSYEAIGLLIKEKVAASKPVLEVFFRVVLYNYLLSNGDAHLKNFSLVSEGIGDYTLSKSYDLLCTVLHTPHESDTALELFEGDLLSSFYLQYGYFGRPDFEELAKRLELKPHRATASINVLLSSKAEVIAMIERSFLSDVAKGLYLRYYEDKLGRFSKV